MKRVSNTLKSFFSTTLYILGALFILSLIMTAARLMTGVVGIFYKDSFSKYLELMKPYVFWLSSPDAENVYHWLFPIIILVFIVVFVINNFVSAWFRDKASFQYPHKGPHLVMYSIIVSVALGTFIVYFFGITHIISLIFGFIAAVSWNLHFICLIAWSCDYKFPFFTGVQIAFFCYFMTATCYFAGASSILLACIGVPCACLIFFSKYRVHSDNCYTRDGCNTDFIDGLIIGLLMK